MRNTKNAEIIFANLPWCSTWYNVTIQITEELLRERMRIQNTVKHLRQHYARGIMPACGWICINISKYPWKRLNKLFWLCQNSKYAWSPYIFNKLWKVPQILNMPGLYKQQELHRVPNISENGTICLTMPEWPQYSLTSLKMLEHSWMFLNATEYAWQCKRFLWLCQSFQHDSPS